MAARTGTAHVVTTTRTYKGKTYHTHLLRRSYREDGCPVAVSVHEGNVADSATLVPEVQRLRQNFGIEQLVMVGDRGMIGNASIAQLREMAGSGWITALKNASVRTLVEQGQLQLGLFDERNLLEIDHKAWRGTLVCDDFSGYTTLFIQGVTEAGCMAHARRKFIEVHIANKSTVAATAIEFTGQLYGIEREGQALIARAAAAGATTTRGADCPGAARLAHRAARQGHQWHRHGQGDRLQPQPLGSAHALLG